MGARVWEREKHLPAPYIYKIRKIDLTYKLRRFVTSSITQPRVFLARSCLAPVWLSIAPLLYLALPEVQRATGGQ